MATTTSYNYGNLSKDARAASSRRMGSSPQRSALQKSHSFKNPRSGAAPRRMAELTSVQGSSKSSMKRTKSSPSMGQEGKKGSSKASKKVSKSAVSPIRRTTSNGAARKPTGKNRSARLMARQGAYGAEMAAKNLGKFSAEEFKYEPTAAELMYAELYRPPTRFIGMTPDVENSTDAGIFITKDQQPRQSKASARPKLGKLLSFRKSKSKEDASAHDAYVDPDTQAFYVDIDE